MIRVPDTESSGPPWHWLDHSEEGAVFTSVLLQVCWNIEAFKPKEGDEVRGDCCVLMGDHEDSLKPKEVYEFLGSLSHMVDEGDALGRLPKFTNKVDWRGESRRHIAAAWKDVFGDRWSFPWECNPKVGDFNFMRTKAENLKYGHSMGCFTFFYPDSDMVLAKQP